MEPWSVLKDRIHEANAGGRTLAPPAEGGYIHHPATPAPPEAYVPSPALYFSSAPPRSPPPPPDPAVPETSTQLWPMAADSLDEVSTPVKDEMLRVLASAEDALEAVKRDDPWKVRGALLYCTIALPTAPLGLLLLLPPPRTLYLCTVPNTARPPPPQRLHGAALDTILHRADVRRSTRAFTHWKASLPLQNASLRLKALGGAKVVRMVQGRHRAAVRTALRCWSAGPRQRRSALRVLHRARGVEHRVRARCFSRWKHQSHAAGHAAAHAKRAAAHDARVIGTGLTVSRRYVDAVLNAAVRRAWRRWAESATEAGHAADFRDAACRMLARAALRAGARARGDAFRQWAASARALVAAAWGHRCGAVTLHALTGRRLTGLAARGFHRWVACAAAAARAAGSASAQLQRWLEGHAAAAKTVRRFVQRYVMLLFLPRTTTTPTNPPRPPATAKASPSPRSAGGQRPPSRRAA